MERLDDHNPAPLRESDDGSEGPRPPNGVGLSLSGGGYRAMLFHLGALLRLNELGYLPRIDRIASVSGGSITAGVLALAWERLGFRDGIAQSFDAEVVRPIRRLATKTIDAPAVFFAAFGFGVAFHLRKNLFGDATLQALPAHPTFVINATNVQSGALVRMTRAHLWDYRVGRISHPTVSLAAAVAASAAFPPVLSPFILDVGDMEFEPGTGTDLEHAPYTKRMVLTDGGVYDNLGLEGVWKRCATVLASDGGLRPAPAPRPSRNWFGHMRRIIPLLHVQASALRKRMLLHSLQAADPATGRAGAFWGMAVKHSDYPNRVGLDCPHDATLALAATPTRLCAMPGVLADRIVNWGYASCAAAMASYVSPLPDVPARFPYPAAGVGPTPSPR
jgi:NTE family protein